MLPNSLLQAKDDEPNFTPFLVAFITACRVMVSMVMIPCWYIFQFLYLLFVAVLPP